MDPWYSLGKADMVDAAHLALHFTYMSGRDEIDEMLRCATERGARTLGVDEEYGLEPGKPADCVVFDAPTALEVIRLRATRRWVVRRGKIVAETTPSRTTLLGEPVTFSAR
jgi:cytosine deaminase